MKKIKAQILHNLKKDKGSFVSFGLIILFTAFMLNLALVLMLQVDMAYDAKFEELNTAAVNVCISKFQDGDGLEKELEKLDGVDAVESREAVFAAAVIKDFRDTDFDMNTVFYNMEEERRINLLELREETAVSGENAVWLPLYVANFGLFETGEDIVYEVDGEAHRFSIAGVVEEMQYGNYGKGLMGAYLSEEAYDKFTKEHEANTVVEYSLTAKDGTSVEELQKQVSTLLEDRGIAMVAICDRDSVKDTRTMVCNLLILILAAFACVILLVSVFLCKFRISNSMEEEMVSMGVLKAMGYTGSMIVASLVLPYVLVTMVTAVLGVAASYAVLPALSGFLTMQSGFSFALSFDVRSLLFTEVLLVVIVYIFTNSAAKRIRKIQPINAIRGNTEKKHGRRNYLPLDKGVGSTQLRLIGKQMCACKKQNVLLFLVSFVLTVLVAFSGTLFYNVVIEPENFMSTLSEETPDAVFLPEEDCTEKLAEKLRLDSDVRNVLQYTTGSVKLGDSAVTVFVCEDFAQVTNDLCYAGTNPAGKDQIALGSAFAEEYAIGDTVTIGSGDRTRSYEVTGFVQSVNNQGVVCELTLEGYEALLGEEMMPALYVYLTDGAEAAGLIGRFEKEYDSWILKTMDSQKMAQTTQEMYLAISAVLIAVIFVLTLLIVLFILYIVIKSLLVQRKQELGIYKAMGYSNWQLILQTAGSFLPVTAGAVLISSALGMVYMPWINQVIFQTVGAVKNNMEVSFGFLMAFGALQILMNVLISISLTLPIKKISAYSLIKEA